MLSVSLFTSFVQLHISAQTQPNNIYPDLIWKFFCRTTHLLLAEYHVYARGVTELTFHVSLKPQDQGGPLLQVLSHFLASKSLFWSILPTTILFEYLSLYSLLYPPPSNCWFFHFPLSCFFYYHHFLYNYLISPPPCLAHAFSLVFINFTLFRSSHPEVFSRKGVLEICSKFTGEYPCRSVISMKLQSNFIEIILLLKVWLGQPPEDVNQKKFKIKLHCRRK